MREREREGQGVMRLERGVGGRASGGLLFALDKHMYFQSRQGTRQPSPAQRERGAMPEDTSHMPGEVHLQDPPRVISSRFGFCYSQYMVVEKGLFHGAQREFCIPPPLPKIKSGTIKIKGRS